MKTTVSLSNFRDSFAEIDCTNFSCNGLAVLFDYLEELENDTGEELELDVVALCCDFQESDYESIASDYSIDLSDYSNEDEKIDAVREYLAENTSIVGEVSEGLFIFQNF